MEIGPLLPGRIPGTLITERLRVQLQNAHRDLTLLQDQISTGHKFFLPSDAPSDAVRTIGLQKLQERKSQMLTNVQTNKSLLGATDSALASLADVLNKARQISSAGIGDSSSVEEKQAMALEVQALIRQTVNVGNSTFRGRYLFAGSQSNQPPFTLMADNSVRYEGDRQQLNAYADLGLLLANNIDGDRGLGALTTPVGSDINPALTLQTSLRDLYGGRGVTPGQITVALSSPASTQTIDLSRAKTVGDLKTLIENAFTPGDVTVAINTAKNGIIVTPTAGTVTISDPTGGNTARDFNIVASAAASVDSGDLDPRMTIMTKLADLNGGTGIGPTAGNGLLITNGTTSKVVDISSAVTVEDLLNLLRSPDLNLSADINSAGNGLAISSRLSGVDFSIGENNGLNATNLGIRTLTGSTPLSSLYFGGGAPVNNGLPLQITRRDGTTVNVDLSGSYTVQDVITKINAVDPGNLVASLNTVGNGISLLDNSGTGALSVDGGELGVALGLAGTEPGSNPAIPLIGKDVNPLEVHGGLNILIRLQKALETNDNNELVRLNASISAELTRLTQVRGDVGGRQKTLEEVESRLQEEDLQSKQALSDTYDVDMAEVLTQLATRQTAYEASLRAAAQTLQLNLIDYL